MSTQELEVFALESQKLARSASHYAQKRKMVQKGKTSRGYNPNAISHKRAAVSLDGKLTLNSGQLQDRLAQVKAKTRPCMQSIWPLAGRQRMSKRWCESERKRDQGTSWRIFTTGWCCSSHDHHRCHWSNGCDEPPVPTDVFNHGGGGAVTLQARAAGIPAGRPRDLILGDNFLNAKEQKEGLDE